MKRWAREIRAARGWAGAAPARAGLGGSRQSGTRTGELPGWTAGRGARALVADEDPFYRAILAEQLAEAGCLPLVVADGTTAWELLSGSRRVNLVVLNWLLPGMDGYEICRRLAGHPRRPKLILTVGRIVAQAGRTHPILAHADACLVKPFGPEADDACLRRIHATPRTPEDGN
ncbi:MAG: response regulator [Planctomycetota bacterium]